MTDEKAQARNVTLYPEDIEALNAVAARFNGSGRRNLSQALRYIISEWQKQQEGSHDPSATCTTINV